MTTRLSVQADPIVKQIGGVSFVDRFAHMEHDSAEALDWQWMRDKLAQHAAQQSAAYIPVSNRLRELGNTDDWIVPRIRGGLWFMLAGVGEEQVVRVSAAPEDDGRVLISRTDIAARAAAGAIEIFLMEPSPQGSFIAVGWCADGEMTGCISAYATETGEHIVDAPALLFAGARPAWLPDESGFWVNDRDDEGRHRLRFAAVSPRAASRQIALPDVLGADSHAAFTLQISPDGRRGVLVTEPHEHIALVHVDLGTLATRRFLPDGWDGECDGSWIDGDTYAARINHLAPHGRVVAIPAATSTDTGSWRELIPEGDTIISWAGVIGNRLYVGDLVNLSLRVRMFDMSGHLLQTLALESPGASPSMTIERSVRPNDALVFNHSTLTRSPLMLFHDPATGILRQIGEARHRLNDATVTQRVAISRDGTRIPFFVVHRRNLPPGPHPALVQVEGGFNTSLLPSFPGTFVPFIEAGGIFVRACLRGGGEYGRAWHDAGRRRNKPNVFEDLEAVARTLIAEGLSTPERMALQGASAHGGLAAAFAVVFQPDLWRAIAPVAPLVDALAPLPDIPETAWVSAILNEEFGDPADPAIAPELLRWSPYQNIGDGVNYPAVYQVFGDQDIGAMPFQGRKFAARLDEANAGGNPVHLRVWRGVGHLPTHQAAEYNAEWLAFIMDQLGLTPE